MSFKLTDFVTNQLVSRVNLHLVFHSHRVDIVGKLRLYFQDLYLTKKKKTKGLVYGFAMVCDFYVVVFFFNETISDPDGRRVLPFLHKAW